MATGLEAIGQQEAIHKQGLERKIVGAGVADQKQLLQSKSFVGGKQLDATEAAAVEEIRRRCLVARMRCP